MSDWRAPSRLNPAAVSLLPVSGPVPNVVVLPLTPEQGTFASPQDALRGRRARLVTYGISDEQAFEHGLTCGGTIHVFVEPLDW